MADYTEAAADVRRAREDRDAARRHLQRVQLRGVSLQRASARETRGEGSRDPSVEADLRVLRGELGATKRRATELGAQLKKLAAVEIEVRALQRQVDAAPAEAAGIALELTRLAQALERAPAAERASLATLIQAAQTRRATLAAQLADDRGALATAHTLEQQAAKLRDEAGGLEERARRLQDDIVRVEGRGTHDELARAKAAHERDLAAARGAKRLSDDRLRERLRDLYGTLAPQQLVASWNDELPIALLPLRIETRWKVSERGGGELWVRVYPDDIAVNHHEPELTEPEVTYGQTYWTTVRSDTASTDAAWKGLAKRFGSNRAAWVARQTRPLNWDAALADPSLSLEFPVQATNPNAWTTAPHTRVLPERFVLMAWQGEVQRLLQVGEPVDDIVVLGPSPVDAPGDEASISRDTLDNSLAFGDAFEWVRDFPRAVTAGLAFRVPVTASDVARGFDRLLVLGLKLGADAPEAQVMLEALIEDHHYSRAGFELLRQGVPTNNTDAAASGYTRGGETGVAGVAPPRFTPTDDRSAATDGQRLADLLGLGYAPLLHADGADATDHAEAVAMNRALYPGTLGYYLDQMLNDVVADSARAPLRRHFTDLVTGRGAIAGLRIGNQPYGILPTSSLARWEPSAGRIDDGPAGRAADPFEPVFLAVLQRFDQAWSAKLGGVAQLGAPGDASANLLKVLGLHPTSAEFYQRVGYSYDYLRNLESFAWGGSDFDEVLKLAFEGANARTLLRQLGYSSQLPEGRSKPLPHLLQLIWRHYQTRLDPRQLIDGQPLSESTPIKPHGPTSANYMDWLLANAADANALEAQRFGEGGRPGALLYMMLHFALVMESGRAIHDYLGGYAIQASELVRSRKFLNVSGTSPSVWEVFRAPANRLAAATGSSLPLLAIVHAPQSAHDAGVGLAAQKAALGTLRGLPTARLERVFVEHLDTLSYRLDAWQTSLFTRRLARQRRLDAPVAQRRTGLYLGAFGYLENIKPTASVRTPVPGLDGVFREAGNGGHVHAPSLNHATAAALLRNGYLTHASPADPQALAVNLSSGRVQRARYLIEGIRNGQTLETLLGVQFERGLHDWTTRGPNPVILDQLKPLFRAQFPIVRTRVPQDNNAAAGASEVHEDHQVTNGLTLARSTKPFPYDIAALSALGAPQQDAIRAEKASIENTLDALRDVLTAESAYQLALGNFERAAAVLQSVGSGNVPPDLEVLDTPRGTAISFTQRLAVQFGVAGGNPWPTVAPSERARLEPALNAWLGDLLGDPANIFCRAAAVDAEGTVQSNGAGPIEGVVSLEDLQLQPIDWVYVVRSQAEATGAAELETRVRHAFASARGLADEVIVRISFADNGPAVGARSFAEVLALADRLRRLLGTSKRLDGRHFSSASKDTPTDPDNPGRLEIAEATGRVTSRVQAIRDLFGDLKNAANAARASTTAGDVDNLRNRLLAVARTGFAYAMPRSVTGTAIAQRDLLVVQADALVARAEQLGGPTDQQLTEAAAAKPDAAFALLTEVVKTWMGKDMLLLPRFSFVDLPSVTQADAARDALTAFARGAGSPLPIDEWLHGAACVRPAVHDFEMLRVMADAVRGTPLALAALQLPFRGGDSWLGAAYPPGMEVVHDTVSLVQHLPQGFTPAALQSGLLIDEWTESVPLRESVTGLAFNYNAPNSAPPQAVLLAVTPRETGHWSWDDLVDTVLDTFRRAKLRAVEPDMLGDIGGIGTLLPALVAEFSTSAASVSLDYSLVMAEIRAPVLAMAANPAGGG